MLVRSGGQNRTITSAQVRVGGAVRDVTRIIAQIGGATVTLASFASDLTASASPVSVAGFAVGNGTVTTASTQVTPSGGVSPFTYAWTPLGVATGIAQSPTSAITKFIRSTTAGDDVTEQFRCTVTDSAGSTATVDVIARFVAEDIDEDDFR